jgi:ketosteroid isomerase-like protein
MSNNNLELLRKGYSDFSKGDIPAVLAVFDPKIKWTAAEGFPYSGTYTGPEEVTENIFMKLGTEWDGWKVSPKEFIDAGERIVVTGKYSGTCKATGKSFEADFAHIWTIHDGKATNFVQYADTALVQEAFRK